ncbi:hypothetical protein QG9_1510 [Clostridioides difficile CD178]|uniref:Uncharacterized protein n=1 Tax=Myoviridae sp. ct4QN2 TaxID=2825030 RepID=A0A8S5PW45_9CAUD|nr:hypothetical protein QG9_1510 [Clostridioides difficile CD178]DAE10723.1 MAG TPA: hypothetical protein [Myoviridae sp. ct4QN2]
MVGAFVLLKIGRLSKIIRKKDIAEVVFYDASFNKILFEKYSKIA